MPEGSLFHVPRAARRAPGSILRASAIGLQRVYSAARTSFLDSNFSLGLNDIDMYVGLRYTYQRRLRPTGCPGVLHHDGVGRRHGLAHAVGVSPHRNPARCPDPNRTRRARSIYGRRLTPVQSVLLPVGGPSATAAGTLSRDALRKASGRVNSDCVLPWTAELEHVPVKDVIVGEALFVEQVAEELP